MANLLAVLQALAIAVPCTVVSAQLADHPAAGTKPHLVFVYVDDWGYADVGFRNPNISSPTFDQMASNGVILDRHYVFKFCSPSRASFLSGRFPHHAHQFNIKQNVPFGLNLNFTILPQKLKKAGYATHMMGKWHLGFYKSEYLPVNRGFDTSSGFLGGGEDHMDQQAMQNTDFWRNHAPDPRNGSYDAFTYREDIETLLTEHDPSTPFFLYLALHNVHSPFQAPQDWIDHYSNQSTCSFRKTYQAMVSVADNVTGTVVEMLKKRGMWDNSLIVVSSDNGGAHCAGSNYPLRGRKSTFFEGGVRASAFASGGMIPADMKGKTVTGAIHTSDWYPTFCYLAGVDPDDSGPGKFPVDGLNVWPLLTGAAKTTAHKEIVLSYRYYPNGGSGAMIMDPYKLIVGQQRGALEDVCLGTWWTTEDSPCHNGTDGPDCDKTCLYNVVEVSNLTESELHKCCVRFWAWRPWKSETVLKQDIFLHTSALRTKLWKGKGI